jgi:hypothetical protein
MNPLQKYFRQPKIYISLPSKGNYYPKGSLDGDPNNIPVFAMTGLDELVMKTPDALFNGEASIKLIESCCPYIKNAKEVPSIDVDTLLSAIRLATFGSSLIVSSKCKNCGGDNDYEINLQSVIDYYGTLQFNNTLKLSGGLIIYFKPITYHEMSLFNIENFGLQKVLGQLHTIEDIEQRQQLLDDIYGKIANIQVQVFLNSIESINAEDITVTDKDYIKEWIANSDREDYDKIKKHLEENKKIWSMPSQHVACMECKHEDKIDVILDQSHFFV